MQKGAYLGVLPGWDVMGQPSKTCQPCGVARIGKRVGVAFRRPCRWRARADRGDACRSLSVEVTTRIFSPKWGGLALSRSGLETWSE